MKTNKTPIFFILFAGLILRLFLVRFGTLELDFNTFVSWSNILASQGFRQFYLGWSDYLPGYLYVLSFITKIKAILPLPSVLLYKLPAILSDLATGYLIFQIVCLFSKKRAAMFAATVYVFNPAIFANSTLWGQVDSLVALFSVLGIKLLLEKKTNLSGLSFAIGTLIKPQVVFMAPVVLFIAHKQKMKPASLINMAAVSLIVFTLAFVPFLPAGENLIRFIIERVNATLGQYPYTSLNAFNMWGVYGMWKSDMTGNIFSAKTIGYSISALVSIFTYVRISKSKNIDKNAKPYLFAAVMFSVSFLFFTRIHERHLLPTLAPLSIASAIHPHLLISYIGFSITYVLNLFYSYIWIEQNYKQIISTDMVKLVGIANITLFIWMIFATKFPKKFLGKKIKKIHFSKPVVSEKLLGRFLFLILIFALATRLIGLSHPDHEYFDEVYHAFTARRMLNHDIKAWEWWNTPPEGYAYEWTHPPLAKEMMVVGMSIFGENSFGWRFPGAIFGVLIVYLGYKIAKEIFDDELLAVLSAFILSVDGLLLVMNRIGMNDTYFLAFALASLYFLLRDKYLFSSVMLGLAAASKWSVFWFAPILALAFIVFGKKLKPSIVWFLIIPPVIYVISYLPMFLHGHGWDVFIGVQKQMWWYHTRLEATHPYTSQWWSWPLMLRPIWFYVSTHSNGFVENIYAMGNPAVFWSGFIAVVAGAYIAFVTHAKRLGFVIFSYFMLFVPWAVSPRIMFLYHYLPSIPFLALALAFILRKHQRFIPTFVVVSLVLFVYFYPHWIGVPVPKLMESSYYWLSSWR